MAAIGSIAYPRTKMSNRSMSLSWRCAFPNNRSSITSRTIACLITNQTLVLATRSFPQASPETPSSPTALHLRPKWILHTQSSPRRAVAVRQLASKPQWKMLLRTWHATTTSDTTTIEIGTQCTRMCVLFSPSTVPSAISTNKLAMGVRSLQL